MNKKEQHEEKDKHFSAIVELQQGVLVLHLNGKHDNQKMQHLTEQLRKHIEEMNSSVALVDVTAMPNISGEIVRHLVDIIGILRLTNTQVLLVRKDLSIDRELTRLRVDLSDITTCHSLLAGLWMALDIVESRTTGKTD